MAKIYYCAIVIFNYLDYFENFIIGAYFIFRFSPILIMKPENTKSLKKFHVKKLLYWFVHSVEIREIIYLIIRPRAFDCIVSASYFRMIQIIKILYLGLQLDLQRVYVFVVSFN